MMIETESSGIEAMDVIEGIPIDPVHPPSPDMIDPHRRWMIEAERVWIDRSWIILGVGDCVLYHLRGSGYRPEIWGRFATPQQAADYIAAPVEYVLSDWSDEDMDF